MSQPQRGQAIGSTFQFLGRPKANCRIQPLAIGKIGARDRKTVSNKRFAQRRASPRGSKPRRIWSSCRTNQSLSRDRDSPRLMVTLSFSELTDR